MKTIRPATREQAGYPTAARAGLTRRGFLRVVTAGAVGAGIAGEAWVVVTEAKARPRGGAPEPHYQIAIDFERAFQHPRCSTAIQGFHASTWDHLVATYLRAAGERPGVIGVVLGILRKSTCEDLRSDIRRRRIERAIEEALAALYRKRTLRRYGSMSVGLKLRPPQKIFGPIPSGGCGDRAP